jgi:hypothetical protein
VRVRIAEIPHASAEYDPAGKTITLDTFQVAQLDGLVHELLHHCHYHRLASWGAGEEPVTEALEDTLVRYINRNKRRNRWWRNALRAKLAEGGA